MNISAEEVEFILYRHPKILNVVLVGMPDDRLGEKACAYVELKEKGGSLTLKEIQEFMDEQKVAKYKWPERIEIVEELPRTPTGKVLKYVLREEISKKVEKEA
jgi:non-ribosomal peptide synthetase component E (peptide arylation enzyme)